MNNTQEIMTLVSDVKFALTKLDPARHQPLIDLLIDCNDKFENTTGDFNPLITQSINEINDCISKNKMTVPNEITELIQLFSAFLPK
ncbi:hypothetical protein [uncultured Clostridium sp.]|uniref:hypothetical protein n=1 Tax=uncultured Clostridium sp. TaxID=59620 RepID=UPI0025F730B3|nr:hypothetical protein [uncultured Clostridium sp.]